MDIREELKSAGVYPTGPVSAWPEERNIELHASATNTKGARKVNASVGKMASGFIKTADQAIRRGGVAKEIRDERYESKRCSECGCFMEAKTWVGGDPKKLCPKKKWVR
jgi:hypothetical protein